MEVDRGRRRWTEVTTEGEDGRGSRQMDMKGEEYKWMGVDGGRWRRWIWTERLSRAGTRKPQESLNTRSHERVGAAQWNPHSKVVRSTG